MLVVLVAITIRYFELQLQPNILKQIVVEICHYELKITAQEEKSLGFFLWGPQMSVLNVMVIYKIVRYLHLDQSCEPTNGH